MRIHRQIVFGLLGLVLFFLVWAVVIWAYEPLAGGLLK